MLRHEQNFSFLLISLNIAVKHLLTFKGKRNMLSSILRYKYSCSNKEAYKET